MVKDFYCIFTATILLSVPLLLWLFIVILTKLKSFWLKGWSDYRRYRKDFYLAFFVALPLVLPIGILLLAFRLFTEHQVDTQIRADFSVREFTFTLKQEAQVQSMLFESMTIHKFKQISFNSTELVDTKDNHIGAKHLEIQPLPKDERDPSYNVTLTAGSEEGTSGQLQQFSINPETIVTVRIHPVNRVTIELASNGNNNILSEPVLLMFKKPFQLESLGNQISSITTQNAKTEFKKVELSEQDPYVNVTGQLNELKFSFTYHHFSGKEFPLFSEYPIKIENSKLFIEKKDDTDERKRMSTLTEEGTISYVGFPEKKEIPFMESDLVEIGVGSKFALEKTKINFVEREKEKINIRLQGIVTELKVKSPLFPDEGERDYRITFYDKLEEHKPVKSIFESIEWLILGIIAVAGIILVEKFKDLFKKDNKTK